MARRRQETEDEITEADDTAGAATFGGSPTRGPRQPRAAHGRPGRLRPRHLMGLYLSEASGHQKAYKELLASKDANP